MANSYYDATGKDITNGETSDQTNINDINTAIEGAFDDVESDFSTLSANVINWTTLAAEWAEKAEDSAITGSPGQYSALHHSAKSNAQRVLAEAAAVDTAADVVTTNADAAITTQDAIDTAADAASTAQDAIDTAADAVSTDADATSAAASAALVPTFSLVGTVLTITSPV